MRLYVFKFFIIFVNHLWWDKLHKGEGHWSGHSGQVQIVVQVPTLGCRHWQSVAIVALAVVVNPLDPGSNWRQYYKWYSKIILGNEHTLHKAVLLLTHWGLDKMAAIFQATFINAFSWMKMYESRLRFHWSLFLWVQLTIFQNWLR